MSVINRSWLLDVPISQETDDLFGYKHAASYLAQKLHDDAKFYRFSFPEDSEAGSFSLLLEGRWGSGKTSYSNLLVEMLSKDGDIYPPNSLRVIRFNIWQSKSMEISAWASLAYRLGQEFYSQIHRQCIEVEGKGKFQLGMFSNRKPNCQLAKISMDFLRDPRLHWVEVAQRISQKVPQKNWDPCYKLFCDAPSKVPGRGMDWREGSGVLNDLSGAAIKVALLKPDKAVDDVFQSIKGLGNKRLLEGSPWGVDTLEFINDLNLLLYSLNPIEEGWRGVIIVDDIARLDESDFPFLLETLAYLKKLNQILVILNIDYQTFSKIEALKYVYENNLKKQSVQVTESFLTKMVNLRIQVPLPSPAEQVRSLIPHHEHFGFPTVQPFSDALRHLLDHGINTPRQIKNALRWFSIRLGSNKKDQSCLISSPCLSSKIYLQIIIFMSDLYLYCNGFIEGKALVESVESNRNIFLNMGRQPWNLRPWADQLPPNYNKSVNLSEAKDLLSTIRFLALVELCHVTELESYRKTLLPTWYVFYQKVSAKNYSKKIFGKEADQLSLCELVLRLKNIGKNDPKQAVDMRVLSQLFSAARHAGLVKSPKEHPSSPFVDFFDLEHLFRGITETEWVMERKLMSLVLLHWLNPNLANIAYKSLIKPKSKKDGQIELTEYFLLNYMI